MIIYTVNDKRGAHCAVSRSCCSHRKPPRPAPVPSDRRTLQPV